MHPVANQVDIPTDKIGEALERCAVPGFTGSVRGHIRVLPSAAHEVEFLFEKSTTMQINKPVEPERPIITNARVAKVRTVLLEHAHLFRLGTPVSGFFATFVDGELRRFELNEVI